MSLDEDGKVLDTPSAGSALVANILYDKIPPNIQWALWQITRKRYPTLREILENIKEAVDIAQMQFDKSSNVPKGKQVSESKVSSTVNCVNVSKSSKNSESKFKRKFFLYVL